MFEKKNKDKQIKQTKASHQSLGPITKNFKYLAEMAVKGSL